MFRMLVIRNGACAKLLGSVLLGSALSVASAWVDQKPAYAQDVIDLDKDADVDLDEGQSGEAVAAGQMTQDAAAAKRLFDQQKWSDAALGFYRVVAGETGDDPGNQQLAQYYLAISLYRMKLYQASYALFSLISESKTHLKFRETLLWLAKLATQLPEPADIIERVGKYSDDEVARFNNGQQRELFYQLNYMLGRYRYRNRQYEDSIRLLNKVAESSQYYVQAQFFQGISYVQLRKSIPAVNAFQRVINALDKGVKGVEDEDRMHDLALLSMARTYYSASIKLDPETNASSIDSKKLSAAVKYWNSVDEGSEYWLDALFEESWAYFMAGDYPRALGNIHTIEAPYFPNSFKPEADILQAVIYFFNCNYEAAISTVARFNLRYRPIREELGKVLKRYEGKDQEGPFFKFLVSVRDGTADLDPTIKGIVENALGDRQLLRNIEYVRVLDDEIALFNKSAANFRSSGLGQQIQDAVKFAREIAVKNAGELAMSRYRSNIADLDEHLRDGDKLLIDITAASRNLLDEALQSGQVSKAESKIYGVVKPDEEHVIWPYNGEYWRDELGFYRQVVESACGR
ncbi:MAG TPA: hypothetical protein VL137_16295 [Polyangiaceae bacterium]|nr:hypothetical protein [Polyangiaceae bacterium]